MHLFGALWGELGLNVTPVACLGLEPQTLVAQAPLVPQLSLRGDTLNPVEEGILVFEDDTSLL